MLKTLGPHSSQGPGPAHRAPIAGVGGRPAKTSLSQLSVRDHGVDSRGVQFADKETYPSDLCYIILNRSSWPGLIIESCLTKHLPIPTKLFAVVEGIQGIE